jgi:hypothetical protein
MKLKALTKGCMLVESSICSLPLTGVKPLPGFGSIKLADYGTVVRVGLELLGLILAIRYSMLPEVA